MEAAVGDVELVGEQLVALALDRDVGAERRVAGQDRQRRERVGGAAHDALEPRLDLARHLDGDAEAGQVGERPVVGHAEVDVGHLALGEHLDRAGQVERQAEAAGEVVGGAERQHAERDVAVGDVAYGGGQGAVAAADDEQVGVGGEGGVEQVAQALGVVDRQLHQRLEAEVVDLLDHLEVVAAPAPRASVHHHRHPAIALDRLGVLVFGAQFAHGHQC